MAPGSCCHCWHGAVNGSSVVFVLGERATGSGHGSVVSRDACHAARRTGVIGPSSSDIGHTDSVPWPTSSDATPSKRTIQLQQSGAFGANQTRPRPARLLPLQTAQRQGLTARPTSATTARSSSQTPPNQPRGHQPTITPTKKANRGRGRIGAFRPEMRGGSRPAPVVLFLLAASGICAQFTAG